MEEEKSLEPTIKLDEAKERLCQYVEENFPGVLEKEQVEETFEDGVHLIRKVDCDYFDKFLVAWRFYLMLQILSFKIFGFNKHNDLSIVDVSLKMGECLEYVLGKDLAEATKESCNDGSYQDWCLTTRYRMWRNGYWPLRG